MTNPTAAEKKAAAAKAEKERRDALTQDERDAEDAENSTNSPAKNESAEKTAFRIIVERYEKQNPTKFNKKDEVTGKSKGDLLKARLAAME